jgi:F420-0:gamma-glutamyl ligase-like protein
MTDTVTEKITRTRKSEVPVQVPVPHDPLYTHVIGSLETDLSIARERAQKAEKKVKELSEIADQVELLRDTVNNMRNELEATKNIVLSMNTYTESMYKIISKTFRS